MGKIQKTQQKSTSEGVFSLLSDSQWRFVAVMVANPDFTKADAARALKIKPNTVYAWPDHVNAAIEQARIDVHEAAVNARKQALLEAIRVKIAGLRSRSESIRQKAASEIIEWELGRASTSVDVTSAGQQIKGYIGFSPDDWDNDSD